MTETQFTALQTAAREHSDASIEQSSVKGSIVTVKNAEGQVLGRYAWNVTPLARNRVATGSVRIKKLPELPTAKSHP
jgi:hypothetical protein